MPPIVSDDYIPRLLDVCRRERIDALLSCFDQDIDKLSQYLDDFFSEGVVPILPPKSVSDICFDKYRTYQFLTEHGLTAPQTFTTLEEAREALENGGIAFPLVVKPRFGFASRNLFFARSTTEMEVFFHYDANMIIQECLDGHECSFDICNDLERGVVSVVYKRKLAMRAGETDQAEVIHDEQMIAFGQRLGELLGHIGPLDVDVFVRGDGVVILELNPRFGGGYPISHLAGAAFPEHIVRMVRGEPSAPSIGGYRHGVVMMKEYRIVGGDPSDIFGETVDAVQGVPETESLV